MTNHNSSRQQGVSPPGDTISDLLEEKGWTQAELCLRLDYTTKHVSLLINGKAPITEDTALRLERVLGGDMAFWLTREAQYREALARINEAESLESQVEWLKDLPLSDMIRFKWIKRQPSKGLQVAECLRYFGVASADSWRENYSNPDRMGLAYRASDKFEAISGHVGAWLRRGEIESEELNCEPFNLVAFKSVLGELRKLTVEHDPKKFAPALVNQCAKVGVAVVFVPAPQGCPICGVTRWLSGDKAMLMLSLRYKTNDHLWFTFFHEAAHLILHSKKMMFLEMAKGGIKNKEENEADAWARDWLISREQFQELRQIVPAHSNISNFANKIGIAPGIVVGRLQNEKVLPWSSPLNSLKVRYTWDHG